MNLILGDCIEVMKTLEANSVDTIITDPPYGLEFMGKEWDNLKRFDNRDKKEKSGSMNRKNAPIATAPTYGSGCGIQEFAFQWATEALRVAKPGAMMLCFGGTRTFHRIACGIEDAGWEIRDTMMWIYGSGFPKSYNIGKNLEGWDGWGTALKPAFEPIIVAMKPKDGTFVESALKWGVAGLNIDGGRIGISKSVPASPSRTAGISLSGSLDGTLRNETGNEGGHNPNIGRWPANVIHDGSEEVVSGFPESKNISKGVRGRGSEIYAGGKGFANTLAEVGQDVGFGDSGSAARFFYCAKASKKERNNGGLNNHPTVKPLSLMTYLARLTATPTGGLVLDPFMGSGTTGMACKKTGRDFIGIELDPHYFEIAKKRIESVRQVEMI